MLRVNTSQQFAFVEAESDGVIGLPCSWLPDWLLASQNGGKGVKVGDQAAIDRHMEGMQSGLMRQECRTVILPLPCLANSGQYVHTRSS